MRESRRALAAGILASWLVFNAFNFEVVRALWDARLLSDAARIVLGALHLALPFGGLNVGTQTGRLLTLLAIAVGYQLVVKLVARDRSLEIGLVAGAVFVALHAVSAIFAPLRGPALIWILPFETLRLVPWYLRTVPLVAFFFVGMANWISEVSLRRTLPDRASDGSSDSVEPAHPADSAPE